MSPITTHVLDTSAGRPAVGVGVKLFLANSSGEAELVGQGKTNSDGRVGDLLPEGSNIDGTYRLEFDTATYFAAQNQRSFYPRVEVTFEVNEPDSHYHVPLLLSPFGYTTYRGS